MTEPAPRPAEPSPRAGRSTLATNLIVAAIAVGVSVVLGELALRPFVTLPLPRTLPEVKYAPHKVRRFTLLPSQNAFTYGATATIDGDAFRRNGDRTGSEGTSSATAIVALGDSFTFGMGVDDASTWPAQTEALLRASIGSHVRILNAGTISYGAFQEMDLLREVVERARPGVVIHALYWNDFMNPAAPGPGEAPAVTGAGYFVWDGLDLERSGPRTWLSAIASRSAFLHSVRRSLAAASPARRGTSAYARAYDAFLDHGLTAEEWRPVHSLYQELAALGRSHNFQPFVVILPVSGLTGRGDAPAHPYPAMVKATLDQAGIPHLDAFTPWFRDARAATTFLPQGADSHLNATGYAQLSRLTVDTLLGTPAVVARLQPAPKGSTPSVAAPASARPAGAS
jgi:lysophospholipase L1-like esterase